MDELSEYERQTGHQRARHPEGYQCTNDSCVVCNLFICDICNGAEGSLLPKCPGRRLTFEEDQRNYHDYCNGSGAFEGTKYGRPVE